MEQYTSKRLPLQLKCFTMPRKWISITQQNNTLRTVCKLLALSLHFSVSDSLLCLWKSKAWSNTTFTYHTVWHIVSVASGTAVDCIVWRHITGGSNYKLLLYWEIWWSRTYNSSELFYSLLRNFTLSRALLTTCATVPDNLLINFLGYFFEREKPKSFSIPSILCLLLQNA